MNWADLTQVASLGFHEGCEWTELRVWARETDAVLFWAVADGGSGDSPFEYSPSDYELRPLVDLGQFGLVARRWAREALGGLAVAERVAQVDQVITRVLDCLDGSHAAKVAEARAELVQASTYAIKLRKDLQILSGGVREANVKVRDARRALSELVD